MTATAFEDREAAFERGFTQKAEMAFKAIGRRDRAIGLWAAELLGKTGAEATEYMREVVRADIDDPQQEAALRKLTADLRHHADEATIRAKLAEFLAVARAELDIED